jgi:hypothetical protein
VVWPWRRDRSPRRGPPAGVVPADPQRSAATSGAADRDPPNPLSDPHYVSGLRPIPTGVGSDAAQASARRPARDLTGVSPAGDPVELAIGGYQRVLLAFLATKCDGCDAFWRGLGGAGEPDRPERPGLPPDVTPVIVTKGPSTVAAGEVAALADPGGNPVIMSDQAWADYRVLGYPFFVLVDGSTRTVVAETVGFGWDDLVELVWGSDR